MNRRIVRRITLWLLVGLILLGCASPVFVTPPPSLPASGGIKTIVVQTAAAAQTKTAILLPTSTDTPTNTPLPTRTATITPTPTSTIVFLFLTKSGPTEEFFGDEGGNGGGNGGEGGDNASGYVKPTVVKEWACRVTSRYPPRNAIIAGGSTFRATWTVVNSGTKTWPKNGVDVVYRSGAHLHEGKPYLDIPATVGPGGKITISITMTAPKRPNEYSTRWALRVGETDFCQMKIAFEVK